MIRNNRIADILNEIADLLELQQANPFRIRAYRRAARTVGELPREVGESLAAGAALTDLPGIGEDLAGKIADIAKTGGTELLYRLRRELPGGLVNLLKLPGLGPKRVKLLYDKLRVASLPDLLSAARQGKLAGIAGFGPKTTAAIIAAAQSQSARPARILRWHAKPVVEEMIAYLKEAPGVGAVSAAGSYRRARETVGDIDIVATAAKGAPVIAHFIDHEDVGAVVAKGPTRATVLLQDGLQVDLRVVPKKSYGAALVYFTGSKAHNIAIRRLAQQRGLKINEYGVFRGERQVAGADEESVYRALDLAEIPPELREDRGEIDAARTGALPNLVRLPDLNGDLHCHTKATDGRDSLEDMVKAARRMGHRYLAITEHSRHLTVTHGLDSRQLLRQAARIDELNESMDGFRILKGIEVDILEDGRLDLPDRTLGQLDLVIGAIHSHFGLSAQKQTDRLLRALDQKYFTILAHPTARLLGEREACKFDMQRIIEAAKARGCFLELNAQPQRLDLDDVHCQAARAAGILVSIGSDAHDTRELGFLEYGVGQARRGWLSAKDVLNARPLAQLLPLLRRTMG
jgi:DNA polymerase (family 10)